MYLKANMQLFMETLVCAKKIFRLKFKIYVIWINYKISIHFKQS